MKRKKNSRHRSAQPLASSSQPTQGGLVAWLQRSRQRWLPVLLLIIGTLLVYLPALDGKFLWDDESWTASLSRLMTNVSGLGSMWSKPTSLQQYYPLTATTFWIDHQLWGAR